jgi:Fuc2NAc and GlcNAc transferase
MNSPPFSFPLGPLALLVLASFVTTLAVQAYAARRLLDLPNDRSSHARPTPRGGGLAIVACFGLGALWLYSRGWLDFSYAMALAGALPVAAVGFLDDHGHVPARWRLLVHIAAAVWALAWLGGFEVLEFGGIRYRVGLFGSLMAALFIAWLVNLYNFMDGLDGIAGTEAIALCLGAAWLLPGGSAEAAPWLILAAATAGFLVWNWPPARIFLGDVGSGALGFLLGVMALRAASRGDLSLAAWHILAGVFYVDASLTLVRRMATGQRWYEAHRSHAYQHAAARSGSHVRVTLPVLAIDLLWLLPWAAAAVAWPRAEALFLVLACAPLAVLAVRLGAGKS